jgi:hypothetical protein
MPSQLVRAQDRPVFVLCGARSGSTLLRFLLDTHHLLACPAETNIPALSEQLAKAWSTIDGQPAAQSGKALSPGAVSGEVLARVRSVTDELMAGYLARQDKQRFCDKSLGAAQHAGLLQRLYPQAQFICLVRHPMDFIASVIEACPWGPIGYGFDQYVTGGSGNMVLALARYWNDHTHAIVSAALAHPQQCYRVRYEDLVDAPEQVCARIFGFLGVPPQPGISSQCFSVRRDERGQSQSDHKIWWTSEVTGASVGRGVSVPPGLIEPAELHRMNALLGELGYARVDASWGTPHGPADPRIAATRPQVTAGVRPAGGGTEWLAGRLSQAAAGTGEEFRARWSDRCAETFACVVRTAARQGEARWLVNIDAGTVVAGHARDGYDWCLIGEATAWTRVLDGQTDMGTALRQGLLRYYPGQPAGLSQAPAGDMPAAEYRLAMAGDLLGLTPWRAGARPGEQRSAIGA